MKEFKAAGIEIPYNQHDIRLRDLDGVRALLNRLAEERAPKSTPPDGAKPNKAAATEVEAEPPASTEPPPEEAPPARGG
jgi:hypothetical protein